MSWVHANQFPDHAVRLDPVPAASSAGPVRVCLECSERVLHIGPGEPIDLADPAVAEAWNRQEDKRIEKVVGDLVRGTELMAGYVEPRFHLIHVAGGTIISAFSFTTDEKRREWHELHYDDPDREPFREPDELPNGEQDDHESDTWVWLEGVITTIDNETPEVIA